MELINSTRMVSGCTMGVEPSGREFLVVVVKGTFRIPADDGAMLTLHEEQVPLIMSDQYFGKPGLSAPMYEVDFALRKGRCDILLNASAYAPNARPTSRIEVAVHVGNWNKTFSVVGDRIWEAGEHGITGSSPLPFVRMPITYDRAFGGVDAPHEDPHQHAAFMGNPSGRGFHSHSVKDRIHGTPMPNTEEIGRPVLRFNGDYNPMSFGPLGRHWAPRLRYAGTYDELWRNGQFPFLPLDFDDMYYQSAPSDQQLTIPIGEQQVRLINLTPDGVRTFGLPHLEAPVSIFPKSGDREDFRAPVDTVVIEPDVQRVTLTWRVARPLKKNMHELSHVLVGKKSDLWWRGRDASVPIRPKPAATHR
jgi:hypothetical protein